MDQKSRTAASTASIQPVIWRRETRGGRTLEYELKVIQQPERARACGSGAKSSADRRPVDPPPVVELCIWDINGMGPHGKEDVTFSYEANFFLFATLEVHRAYAMARGQAPHPAQQVPVLTGMPVSGMAYLDRPKEAGYFIFPDLSVRHEGKYRLSFNLYEETKRPEDTDKEVTADGQSIVGGAAPEASFDWRMEVKSTEFTVYSAKKFPGLAESTNLSRTVAEQGCRVRIRRDVRMRRRDGKPTGDYDEAQEEEARGREQEQFNRERSRSNSAGSDMGQRNAGYSSPTAPQPIRPVGGYLGDFGGQSQTQSFAPPPLPVAASQSYPRPQPSYNHPTVGPLNTTGFQQPQQINHHQQFERQYPQSARAYAPQENFEIERRASYAGHGPVNAPPHAQQAAYYPPPPERQYSQFPPQPYRRPSESGAQTQLPPIRAPEGNHESFIPPSDISSLRNLTHAPSSAPMYPRGHGNSYPPQPHFITPQPHIQQEIVQTGSKRGFESAFTPDVKPLRDGQRPNADHENDDIEVEEEATLEYKRADGTAITRSGIPYKG